MSVSASGDSGRGGGGRAYGPTILLTPAISCILLTRSVAGMHWESRLFKPSWIVRPGPVVREFVVLCRTRMDIPRNVTRDSEW